MCKLFFKMYRSILPKYNATVTIMLTVLGILVVTMLTLQQVVSTKTVISYSVYNNEATQYQLTSAPVKAGSPILPPAPGPRKQFSDFFYVSDIERTRFGEFIWFWAWDTLSGPLWSNDSLPVHTGAVFCDSVWVRRITPPGSGTFHRGYIETNTRMRWSRYAYEIRNAARSSNGHYFENPGNTRTTALMFHGFVADVWQWESGTQSPFIIEPPTNAISWNLQPSAIFVEGDLWVQGSVTGNLAIGASGIIRLMDNLVYSDAATWPYLVPANSPNYLTVVSEATTSGQADEAPRGIIISNTWENGREDAGNHFVIGTSQRRRDIAIHGVYIALNGSISIQQQNDNLGYDPYIYRCSNHGYDERGFIYLCGSIAYKKRDYVHRGNTATTGIRTGYLKSYRYDQRFRTNAPPFQPAISFR
ncbi:MAG: hypothetical protein OEM52_03915 [bacterium]|nr:hypothetical protein [bacterium]